MPPVSLLLLVEGARAVEDESKRPMQEEVKKGRCKYDRKLVWHGAGAAKWIEQKLSLDSENENGGTGLGDQD
ncbi:hypothetical protein BHM03_00063067 [Ensete ventricosum]|nr:hypothetical protein BHM03_00063067 [Ensete ventricosum]